jgi:hypothetical protein
MPLLIVGVLSFAVGRYSANTTPTATEWQNLNKGLEVVQGQTFDNQEVELDGKAFENCSFNSVTFVFKGERPFILANSSIGGGGGPLKFKFTEGPQLTVARVLVGAMKDFCKNNIINCPDKMLPVTVEAYQGKH